MKTEPIRLPRNFETYDPREYSGAICADCGRPLEVVHDHDESDWPYRFRCTQCDTRAIAEYRTHRKPVERFEKDGTMLRWRMQNMPGYEPAARLRYIALVLQYMGTPEEYAVYEAGYRM